MRWRDVGYRLNVVDVLQSSRKRDKEMRITLRPESRQTGWKKCTDVMKRTILCGNLEVI